MASRKKGNISAIISMAAPWFPMAPRVKMYAGTPTSAAEPKQISWRLVKLNTNFVLTLLKSFGTGTNGIIIGKYFQLA